MTTLLQSDAS